MLLSVYYGTDEFTDFLIHDITTTKLTKEPRILINILSRYFIIGDDDNINKIAYNISKKNSKYTKEYICKNMIKLLNVIISRIDVISPIIIETLHPLIIKFSRMIQRKNTFLIKCLKNIINADKLYIKDDIHIIKRYIDKQIKYILEVDEGIDIKGKNFKSLVKIFNNADLDVIVKKLDMK